MELRLELLDLLGAEVITQVGDELFLPRLSRREAVGARLEHGHSQAAERDRDEASRAASQCRRGPESDGVHDKCEIPYGCISGRYVDWAVRSSG